MITLNNKLNILLISLCFAPLTTLAQIDIYACTRFDAGSAQLEINEKYEYGIFRIKYNHYANVDYMQFYCTIEREDSLITFHVDNKYYYENKNEKGLKSKIDIVYEKSIESTFNIKTREEYYNYLNTSKHCPYMQYAKNGNILTLLYISGDMIQYIFQNKISDIENCSALIPPKLVLTECFSKNILPLSLSKKAIKKELNKIKKKPKELITCS